MTFDVHFVFVPFSASEKGFFMCFFTHLREKHRRHRHWPDS